MGENGLLVRDDEMIKIYIHTFTFPKMRKYIRETSMFLIPMASYCKKYYPEYANAFGILKSNIESMNHSMDVMLSKIEALENRQG